MTACIACFDREDHDPDYEEGWFCCRRARDRMAAALRDIPERCDELAGLGYVERDVREGTRAVREGKLKRGGVIEECGRVLSTAGTCDREPRHVRPIWPA